MNSKLTLIIGLSFFLFIPFSEAQTNINGGNVSGTWTKAGSPYLVKGDITIPNDSTLNIGVGVIVDFKGTYTLRVQGRILAIGKSGDSVVFTAAASNWRGIRFERTPKTNDTSRFEYCIIEKSNVEGLSDTLKRGGGLYIQEFSKVVIENSQIRNNKATHGAGIYLTGKLNELSRLRISNSQIIRNASYQGGGGFFVNYYGQLDIYNCDISNNACTDYKGGGVYLSYNSVLNMDNCRIEKNILMNQVGGDGAGLDIEYYSEGKIRNCLIRENSAGGSGAVNIEEYCHLSFENCLISGNQSTFKSKAPKGTGVVIYKFCDVIFHNCDIVNNTKNAFPSTSVAVSISTGCNPIFTNCRIMNNTGIGITFNDFSTTKMINCILANNGGADGINSQTDFYNCVFANNVETEIDGSGFIISSNCNFYNCIFTGSRDKNNQKTQIAIYSLSAKPNFYNCIIDGDSAGFIGIGAHGNFKGVYINNMDVDPQFVNPTVGAGPSFDATKADWSLKNTCIGVSPALNRGTIQFAGGFKLPATDFAGSPRVSADTVDIGPYEIQYPKDRISKKPNVGAFTGLCEASDTTLRLNMQASNPVWEWQRSTNQGNNWTFYSVSSDLSLKGVKAQDSNLYYRALITADCGLKDTFQTVLKVFLPAPLDLGADTASCSGKTVTLQNKYAPVLGNVYLWSNSQPSQSIQVTPPQATKYSLKITTPDGCISLDSLWVKVGNNPVVFIGNDTSIYLTESLLLKAPIGHPRYLWSDNSNKNTLTLNGASLGKGQYNVWVLVHDSIGCSASDTLNLTVKNVGITYLGLPAFISIYPNPAKEKLMIDLSGYQGSESLAITLRDLNGSALQTWELTNSAEIDLSSISKGLYLFEVKTSEGSGFSRLVVE
jgi:hypothetical protein